MSEVETKPRSVRVPLTDAEWRALKLEAIDAESSIGEVVAAKCRQSNGSTARSAQDNAAKPSTKGA